MRWRRLSPGPNVHGPNQSMDCASKSWRVFVRVRRSSRPTAAKTVFVRDGSPVKSARRCSGTVPGRSQQCVSRRHRTGLRKSPRASPARMTSFVSHAAGQAQHQALRARTHLQVLLAMPLRPHLPLVPYSRIPPGTLEPAPVVFCCSASVTKPGAKFNSGPVPYQMYPVHRPDATITCIARCCKSELSPRRPLRIALQTGNQPRQRIHPDSICNQCDLLFSQQTHRVAPALCNWQSPSMRASACHRCSVSEFSSNKALKRRDLAVNIRNI